MKGAGGWCKAPSAEVEIGKVRDTPDGKSSYHLILADVF